MKKVFLLLVCLLLTGCSASIISTVNSDGSVLETVEISEYVSNVYLDDQSPSEYVSNLLSLYKDTLDEEGYSYTYSTTDSLVTITLTKEFSNICTYFNNSLFIRTSSSDISCTNNDGKYEIEGNVSYFICGDDCMEPPSIDSATLTVNFQKTPLSSNATYINDNSYTWNFDSNSDTKIEIVAEETVTLSDIVNNNSTLVLIIAGLVIVFVLVLIGFILYKKYKNNRINY